MPVFEPPPTWAEVVLVDERTRKGGFNPVWLKWFIDLVKFINASGGGSGTTQHNSLGGLQGGIVNEFFHLSSAQNSFTSTFVAASTLAWTAWSPTRTGWTDVGSPTVTGRYCVLGKVCFFQEKIVPGTTCATTAGTSYTSLPVAAAAAGFTGLATMQDITTFIAVGACAFDVANSRCHVPTQVATGNTLEICGLYEV